MEGKILIISVGSMVSQNILETLKNRRDSITIVGTNASPDAPLYDCDKVYLTPLSELPPSDYSTVLSKIIEDEAPDIIIPGRDIDVIILAHLKKDFPKTHSRFITGDSKLASLMEDKWLSFQFAHQEKLPFADSIRYDLEKNEAGVVDFLNRHEFPLLVKPRKGFASKSVSFVMNEDQLSNIPSDGTFIVQEYLGDRSKLLGFQKRIQDEGIPLFYSLEEVKYSMQLYIGPSKELKGSLITIHRMKNGVSEGVVAYEKNDLNELLNTYYQVFANKGWYGPLNIQLQRSEKTGEMKAYEFNGRYTGATAARYVLGYDEVGFSLDLLDSGNTIQDDSCGSQKSALKQTYISSRPRTKIAYLEKHKIWSPGKKLKD
ncbi:hypothetical protein [Flagellimonas sp.]|uniref:hypothetical protein n=1 Tax=Flagellimonas sp. TaxID=2058762 RepID=UPI003F49FF9B